MSRYSANGQPVFCIEAGPEKAPTTLMIHGGPGYFWWPEEVQKLSQALSGTGCATRLVAMQARGCGICDAISPA